MLTHGAFQAARHRDAETGLANTIWKGAISVGEVRVPVRLYSAVEERGISFHLLHEQDMVRVNQVMVDADSEEPVEPEAVTRAYHVKGDTYVSVSKSELDSIAPEASREIEIKQVLAADALDPIWYERPYYLGSDGSAPDYGALVEALAEGPWKAIARWVMRKRHYVGSLEAIAGQLVLITLRFADEVVTADVLPAPEGRALDKRERDLADRLVKTLHAEFEAGKYQDEHQQRVIEFIETKARGKAPRLRLARASRVTNSDRLAEMLSASLKQAKRKQRSA